VRARFRGSEQREDGSVAEHALELLPRAVVLQPERWQRWLPQVESDPLVAVPVAAPLRDLHDAEPFVDVDPEVVSPGHERELRAGV
jgi:hypothetical protein